MSVPSCRHIKEDGVFCHAPALRGRDYCYFHLRVLGRRMRMAKELAHQQEHRLRFPALEDLNSVQVALMQVLDALASGQLEERRAGLLLYGLQQASSNLRHAMAAAENTESAADQERAEEYARFEEDFALPQALDLGVPPEVAFPLAAPEAHEVQFSPWRDPAFRREHVSPEDVELEDIDRTKGRAEYRRRLRQLNTLAWKEANAADGAANRARWVLEAARRNEEIRCGKFGEQSRLIAEMEAYGMSQSARKQPAAASQPASAEAQAGD